MLEKHLPPYCECKFLVLCVYCSLESVGRIWVTLLGGIENMLHCMETIVLRGDEAPERAEPVPPQHPSLEGHVHCRQIQNSTHILTHTQTQRQTGIQTDTHTDTETDRNTTDTHKLTDTDRHPPTDSHRLT